MRTSRGNETAAATLEGVLDSAFLRRLERLAVASPRHRVDGLFQGGRRARRLGTSLEFADFRKYSAGDEPRLVDWGLFGRTEKLFIRRYENEEDLLVHVFVDGSRSMTWNPGGKTPTKWAFAVQAAAALTYIALTGMDRVRLAVHDGERVQTSPPLHGRKRFSDALHFLRGIHAGREGGTLGNALRRYCEGQSGRGVVFIFSDFLEPDFCAGALSALAHLHEVCAVRVIHPWEQSPQAAPYCLLEDVESGHTQRTAIDQAAIAAYQHAFEDHRKKLREHCSARGIRLVETVCGEPLESLFFMDLRRGRVLR